MRTADPSNRPRVGKASRPRTTAARRVALAIAVATTLASACVHGRSLGRWGEPPEMGSLVAAVRELPPQLGPWRYEDTGASLPSRVVEKLQLRAWTHRVYRHSRTQRRVTILLLVGPSGPLVRHPPDVCYGARAGRMVSDELLQSSQSGAAYRARRLCFQSGTNPDEAFVVAYSFGADGCWDVPRSPRLTYAGTRALMKLQLLCDVDPGFPAAADEDLTDLLRRIGDAL